MFLSTKYQIRTLLVWAVLAAALAGASPVVQAGEAAGKKAGSDAASVQDVEREWAQAARALKSYSATQRDQALAKGKEVLDAMDARIDRLESHAASEWSRLDRAARQKREASLRALRRERSKVAEWYGGMKHSTSGAWEEVKGGFIDAYGTLRSSFNEAAAEYDRGGNAKK